jgi:hypothetical protein
LQIFSLYRQDCNLGKTWGGGGEIVVFPSN